MTYDYCSYPCDPYFLLLILCDPFLQTYKLYAIHSFPLPFPLTLNLFLPSRLLGTVKVHSCCLSQAQALELRTLEPDDDDDVDAMTLRRLSIVYPLPIEAFR